MEENLKVGFCEGGGGSKVLQLGVYWICGGYQESFTPYCC